MGLHFSFPSFTRRFQTHFHSSPSYTITIISAHIPSFSRRLPFPLSFSRCVSLSIQCDFTHPALWWHSLPLLSGSSPSPRLQVKSILKHRPQGPKWTVTEFLQPRWAPTTKLRINGRGATTGQKNQCLFIQTWQSRRPSNSPACSSRRCVIIFSLLCRTLSSGGDKMCVLWRGWSRRWGAVAILSSICSYRALSYCMEVTRMLLIDRLSRRAPCMLSIWNADNGGHVSEQDTASQRVGRNLKA